MGRHVIRTDIAGGDLNGTYPSPTLTNTSNVLSIIRANRLDQLAVPTSAVSFNNVKLTSLATPTVSTDATTKGYVDSAVAGGSVFKGTWNATTNTPTLADGSGTAGWTYLVSVAGTQNLGSGALTFSSGDSVVYNGTIWQKVSSGAVVYTGTLPIIVTGSVISANIDTDGTLAANSDTKLATQKAVKTYVDNAVHAISVVSKTINYAILSTDDVIKVTVAGKVMTLPNATTVTGKYITIKNSSGGSITFNTTSSQTVDGSTTGTLVDNQSITVISDTSNWIIV